MVYTDGFHLVADSFEELHAFANSIDLKRTWFKNDMQHPHYPIWGVKCKRAIKMGAILVSHYKVRCVSMELGLGDKDPIVRKLVALDNMLKCDGYTKNSQHRKTLTEIIKMLPTGVNHF